MKWTIYRPNENLVRERCVTYDPHTVFRGKKAIFFATPETTAQKRAIKFIVDACNEKERRMVPRKEVDAPRRSYLR